MARQPPQDNSSKFHSIFSGKKTYRKIKIQASKITIENINKNYYFY